MSAGTTQVERPHGQDRDDRGGIGRLLAHPLSDYYIVVAAAALLLGLGLVMVLSASSVDSLRENGSSFTLFRKQAIWFALGLPLLFLATRLPVRVWRALAYPALFLAVALLALVPLIGTEINGNQNWIVVGGFSIQPSEAAKLALVIWGADLLARKDAMRMLGDTKHLLVPLLPVASVVIGLVLVGDDLGTAMVLMMIVLSLLFFVGTPLRVFLGLGAVLAALVAYVASTNVTRIERLTTFLNSETADPLGTGYQAMQAKLAFASGGWWGLGLGASRQKWGLLPQAQNDTIFAVIGEELGFIGAIAVLLLFGALAFGGLRIALRTDDMFVRLASAAAVTWICFQFLVNVGAVLGMLPIVGLPLPLISYGGSALIPTMLAIGMLLSFARQDPDAKAALRARRERRGSLGARVRRLRSRADA
jgi:cell division protein FtsW